MNTTVQIGKRSYRCDEEKLAELMSKASKQVKRGIYAIERKGLVELVNIPLSVTQIKRIRREQKKQGVKIYANY